MRYNDEITFVTKGQEVYDPDLGEWLVVEEPSEIKTVANVTDLGTTRSVEIFGDIKQGAKVIRTTPLFELPVFWDWIEFDGRSWQLLTHRKPDKWQSLIVQEFIHE